METLMILSIALIISLITLGVMVFAYKASPTQPERGDQSQLSPSHGRKKEAVQLTLILERWALVVDMALQMWISNRLRAMRRKKDVT